MNDSDIIELYWQRSEGAIAESQRAYGAYFYAIANNILSDHGEAEECVSDTWLRAWNAMPPERLGKLSAFFGRSTQGRQGDHHRRRQLHGSAVGGLLRHAGAGEDIVFC